MRAYSLVDPLTGALNRRGLARWLSRLRRNGEQVWVVAADLNGLKQINDRLGHAEGDQVLRESVDGWRRDLPRGGVVARWGGDEFVMVFSALDEHAAHKVLTSLRTNPPHAFAAGMVPLTGTIEDTVRAADPALYADKRRVGSAGSARHPDRSGGASTRVSIFARETRYTWIWVLAGVAFAASAFVAAWETESRTGAVISLIGGAASLAFAVIVAVRGRQFPSVGIVIWITILAVSALAHATFTDQRGAIFQAIFGLPLIAVIVATFYSPRAARMIVGVVIATFGGAFLLAPSMIELIGAGPIVVSALTAWLLLEVIIASSASLMRAAGRDPLTRALNRRGLALRVPRVERHAARTTGAFAVAAIDFDHFKTLNDTFGHARGDAALRDAVESWRSELRPVDVIARIGGDEFVILLPGIGLEDAERILQRLHAHADNPWTYGIAIAQAGEELDPVLHRADQALGVRKALRGTARPPTREG
nr:GGDEF domain-containing protein [Microbacterium excoecariae]